MFKSVPVDWGYEAYLASGTSESLTELALYTDILKAHLSSHCMGIGFQLSTTESLTTRAISLTEAQTNTYQLQMSPSFIQL